MRAVAATLPLPQRYAATTPRATTWGTAEWFAMAQTAIPAVLLLPGTQGVRLYVRIASFAISLALLAWWAATSRRRVPPHRSQIWLIGGAAYIALMLLHPLTSSPLAGAAQLMLYAAVVAPMLWAPVLVRTADQLARVMAVLLVCNGMNAAVGVLQVYDPDRWMPRNSRGSSRSRTWRSAGHLHRPARADIVRPPGLFDTPGSVAGPGMYAALARPGVRDERDGGVEASAVARVRRVPASGRFT